IKTQQPVSTRIRSTAATNWPMSLAEFSSLPTEHRARVDDDERRRDAAEVAQKLDERDEVVRVLGAELQRAVDDVDPAGRDRAAVELVPGAEPLRHPAAALGADVDDRARAHLHAAPGEAVADAEHRVNHDERLAGSRWPGQQHETVGRKESLDEPSRWRLVQQARQVLHVEAGGERSQEAPTLV